MSETDTPPVVFLHGLLGSPHDFDATRALLPADVTSHAPELPIASGNGAATRIEELVDFLEAMLAVISPGPAVLVGNSLGGHVALSLALSRPERVRGLVLSGSSGLFERGLGSGVPRRFTESWVRSKVAEVFHDPGRVTDDRVEAITRRLADRRRALSLVRLARSARKSNLTGVLGRVAAPTLLLWGAEDRITPPEVAHQFRALLPSARLLFVLGAGHAPMIERPAAFGFHLAAFLGDLVTRRFPVESEPTREAA